MKEIINIGVGQAGIQISDSLIKLYLAQHNLTLSGLQSENIETDPDKKERITAERTSEYLGSIFQQTQNDTYRPRFLLLDSQSDVLNHLLKSDLENILIPDYVLSGKQSANTFARSSLNLSRNFGLRESYDNLIRKAAQNCDSLQAFVFNHGIEGGTGSGAVAQLMQIISDIFPKTIKTNFVVGVEKGSSTSVVGPHNVVLGLAKILSHSDTSIISCNRSLHQIADTHLDIKCPNYQNINTLISQANSFYTVFNRFGNSSLNCDLQDFKTNLVIYPKIHYAIPSFSPLVPQQSFYRWGQIYSEGLLLDKCYDRSCQFALKNRVSILREDTNLSAIILARGELDVGKLARAGRKLIKKNMWVNHLPTALKVGVNGHKATRYHENEVERDLKKSVISYRSSMQISEILRYSNHNFDVMYGKRAFVHWFIKDGMEQMQFSEARQELAALQKDCEEVMRSEFIDRQQEYSGSQDDDY